MASSVASSAGRTIATLAIVCGTFLSVLTSTILNVPIPAIARDLHASIPTASLTVSAQGVTFATLLPLGNWIAERFGRRNIYCAALAWYAITAVGAAFAPNVQTLIAMRILQGVSAAPIVPAVMLLLTDLYPADRRAFALSLWAMANSAAQAMGPPLGGLLTAAFGWRAIFAPTALVGVLSCALALRYLPRDAPHERPLEWRGATSVTLAAFCFLTAFTSIPVLGGRSPWPLLLLAAGAASTVAFARAIRAAAQPFVSPQAFREPSYVTSAVGVFFATMAYSAALLAVPLYLTQALAVPIAGAGFLTLVLPLSMALIAPVSSGVVRRAGTGGAVSLSSLAMLAGTAWLAFASSRHFAAWALFPAMMAMGAALAAQYTASAAGATQTEAGRYGAGVGLYNLTRISGAAAGPVLVAIVLRADPAQYPLAFALTSALIAAGLAVNAVVLRASSDREPDVVFR